MRLKAPPFTTKVQSPTAPYPLDAEGCIEVPEGNLDLLLFLDLGFLVQGDNPLAQPRREDPTTTEPEAIAQDALEGEPA